MGGASILVATFNGAAYVGEQLQSILDQVTADDEVIVLDDGSTDGTLAILDDYACQYPVVTVRRNTQNLGVKETFESLLRLSSKDVAFLSDQDDIWIPGRKAWMLEALCENGCVAVLANALIMTDQGVRGPFFPDAQEPDVGSLWRNFRQNNFIGCCMALRREVLDVALPFPATISMHDWWLGSCAIAMGRVRYMATPSLLYRRHSANQSASRRRPWLVVLKDRRSNLLALAELLRRLVCIRRQARA